MEKISYEHRIYESVDDRNLSCDISQKSKKNSVHETRVILFVNFSNKGLKSEMNALFFISY